MPFPSLSFLPRDTTSRPLVSGITEASDISRSWFARSLSVLQRALPRQGSQGHRRYLPSGINQLNARLLEASPSSEPILPAFLRLPVLFPPPRRVRGEAAIRPICRLLIQLVLPPPLRAHHCAPPDPPRRSRARARASTAPSGPRGFRASSEYGVLPADRYRRICDDRLPSALFTPWIRNRESRPGKPTRDSGARRDPTRRTNGPSRTKGSRE